MTLHDTFGSNLTTTSPRNWLGRHATALWRGLVAGVNRMQYARMVAVMNEMSDEHLAAIGKQRSDIPAYAHELIYEP